MSLITLAQARALLDGAVGLRGVERVPLSAANGLFLSETVHATRALPGVRVSAMDGYALRAEETLGATRDVPRAFALRGRSVAGQVPEFELKSGESARIFTGAPLPIGADAVLRQEAAREGEGIVHAFASVDPGKDIREPGEELESGSLLASAGHRLDGATLGLLSTQGLREVSVALRPRVALLTTGDELVPLGESAAAHQVFESNAMFLRAWMEEAGADVVAVERVADDAAQTAEALRRLSERVSLVVTTGGASVGERDYVKSALDSLGATFLFDGVAMKPGKPTALAKLGQAFVLVLPGNPGAAMVGFDQFGRPLLHGLQGAREVRRVFRVSSAQERRKQPGWTYLVSARLEQAGDGRLVAELRPNTGQLLHAMRADGLVRIPPGIVSIAAGDAVEMELFSNSRWVGLGDAP